MANHTATGESSPDTEATFGGQENLDRILVAVCAAIWLVALGAGVAATVALVELGRAHPTSLPEESGTPWLLYTIIGVSAVVIAGSVPLLLRARRLAQTEPASASTSGSASESTSPDQESSGAAEAVPGKEAPTEKLRIPGPSAEAVGRPTFVAPARGRFGAVPEAAIDRLWLRCAAVLGSAMGAATVAIALATYLMAVDNGGGSWTFYGIAAVITAAMPAIPVFYLRQLRALVDSVD